MEALVQSTQRLEQRLFFLGGFLVVAIVAEIFLLQKGKVESFIWLNAYHRPWLDAFFRFFTNIGDGAFAILLAIFLYFVWKKWKCAFLIVISWAFSGLLAQLVKRVVQSPRPLAFFQPKTFPFFINDIMHGGYNSFPSGHTVTAFALGTVLAWYAGKAWQQLVLLLLACLAGYSRIYLSQHFLADVIAGAILGLSGAIACIYFTRHIHNDQLRFQLSGHDASRAM